MVCLVLVVTWLNHCFVVLSLSCQHWPGSDDSGGHWLRSSGVRSERQCQSWFNLRPINYTRQPQLQSVDKVIGNTKYKCHCHTILQKIFWIFQAKHDLLSLMERNSRKIRSFLYEVPIVDEIFKQTLYLGQQYEVYFEILEKWFIFHFLD